MSVSHLKNDDFPLSCWFLLFKTSDFPASHVSFQRYQCRFSGQATRCQQKNSDRSHGQLRWSISALGMHLHLRNGDGMAGWQETWEFSVSWEFKDTLQGTNISHLGKRNIIFKMPFLGDMLVLWRVIGLIIFG